MNKSKGTHLHNSFPRSTNTSDFIMSATNSVPSAHIELIRDHLIKVLSEQCVRDELRCFLENNVFLDEDGDEIEYLGNEFEWSVDLDFVSAK